MLEGNGSDYEEFIELKNICGRTVVMQRDSRTPAEMIAIERGLKQSCEAIDLRLLAARTM